MKRSAFFVLILLTAVCSARAQVVPAAAGRRLVVLAGGEGSAFQPDYAGQGVAQSSPDRLYGIGTYVDADFSRWIQIEAEGRWLRFNQYNNVGENTYMIGPRVLITDFHGLKPYGKFLYGWSSGQFLTARASAWAYGGGVDYQFHNSKFTLRCFDFEYQDWNVSPTLHPYGGSVGLAYKVF